MTSTALPPIVPRLLPGRSFPPYAYLPGRFPHPVRDPDGHSYHAGLAAPAEPEALQWGVDLFNHGYYWEAHEAWEGPWRLSRGGSRECDLLHGLILLAAAGVKLRERKWDAARRHGLRAAAYFRLSASSSNGDAARVLGWSSSALAIEAEHAVLQPARTAGAHDCLRF